MRPAPPRDPSEPNDAVEQVAPKGLFATGTPPLTTSRRVRASLRARVDAVDDPRDIYRVWVPARKAIAVTLTSREQGARLRLLARAGVRAARRFDAATRETLTISNATRTGAYVYVNVSMRSDGPVLEADYSLSVAPSARR